MASSWSTHGGDLPEVTKQGGDGVRKKCLIPPSYSGCQYPSWLIFFFSVKTKTTVPVRVQVLPQEGKYRGKGS